MERETKAVGIIVVSTDRGLAGGLNANVFKQTLHLTREWQGKGAQVSLCLIGTKGLNFLPAPEPAGPRQHHRHWATGRTSRT